MALSKQNICMFLSPNHRLALFLARQYKKPVYPFNDWINSLWEKLALSPVVFPAVLPAVSSAISPTVSPAISQKPVPKLLTTVERIAIFEEIIMNSPLEYPLLRREATAKLVSEAWDLSRQWDLIYPSHLALSEDTQAYLLWAKTYREKCQTENWIDSAALLDYLGLAIQEKKLEVQRKITCLGFEEWTPQQKRFLKICEDAGTQILMQPLLLIKPEIAAAEIEFGAGIESGSEITTVSRLGLQNEDEELTIALQMAKTWLSKNPTAQIGIIIPDLEQKRFAVLRILAQICNPQEYNVAAPIPLLQYPLIDAALLGLNLMQAEIPFEHLSKILRLPFFGASGEQLCQAAGLEMQLRKVVKPMHSLAEYVFFLASIQHRFPKLNDCNIVLQLKKCLELHPHFYGKKEAENWKELVVELLNCLAWPGARTLNEEEQALKKLWEELLIEYVQLGQVLQKHSYAEALKQIRRLAAHKQFLAKSHQSSIDAPIQVLGMLEGLGVPFDYLWVLGMHRDAWPKEPAANPFLPIALQVAHNIPRSSAARELEVAERITQQLANGAKKVIYSYPKQVLEQVTTFSPLIANFPEDSTIVPAQTGLQSIIEEEQNVIPMQEEIQNSIALEQQGPVLPESGLALGGATVLKLQGVCPFRAFAELRLKAEPLQIPSLGLSPAERGEILHQILVIFWQQLTSQAALIALTEEQQINRIKQSINIVLTKWKAHASSSFTASYLQIERDRMLALVQAFLDLEKSRPPFEVIAHEVPEEIILGGLRLKLRIDRIDKLENGDELLIDYKTGQVQMSEWFGERPEAPQLPLYCIARKTKTAAVAFAIIRPDEIRYRGLCNSLSHTPIHSIPNSQASNRIRKNEDNEEIEESIAIPGVDFPAKLQRYGAEETWELQNTAWEKNLENLALEFKSGRATVDPLKGDQSCRSCQLNSLCRRNF